jgi:Subtilase family
MNKTSGRTEMHFPSTARQARNLQPKFQRLVQAFAEHRAELRLDPGMEPERVLVLETIDGVDEFMRAVARIPGMEWLGEWEEESIPADEDFYLERDPEHALRGRVYLVMFNQRALEELLSLWNRFRRNQAFPYGFNRWRQVFARLRDVRYWNERDRVDPGLIRFWESQIASHRERVVVKIELWFNQAEERRAASRRVVEEILREEGGRVLGQAAIPEIAFHAVAAELPANAARRLIELEQTRLAVCDRIMFFRPLGQCAVPFPTDQVAGEVPAREPARPVNDMPIVALLDGLPAVNHALLRDRLVLDDPDGWSAEYQAQERVHGTMMASLIAHGDLSTNEPALSTRIYARPIFKPDRSGWRGTPVECIPEEAIAEDLIHRSVRRLFDGEPGQDPVAPSVRIVSLAIGDPLLLFDRVLSPLAKLLDWLSWKYRILFLISAGNHTADLELRAPRGSLVHMTSQEIERATILAVEADSFNRRLLCPAEAVNAITVGAVHSDSSAIGGLAQRINPLQAGALPSPISAVGLGYRRSVKPDLLFSGGRQLFREKLGNVHVNETLQVLQSSTRAPGHRAASPGPAGNLTATRFFCGTSNATAMGARRGAEVHALLRTLRAEPGGHALDDAHEAVLIKAMMVHGCSWDEPMTILEPILGGLNGRPPVREYAARFLGYGPSETQRVLNCTEQRATLIGCGDLSDGEAHIYSVPLPPSLSAQLVWRKLTVTLAWLTPVHPLHRAYRRAALWFSPPEDELLVRRTQVDWQMAQRGTVQHEILEGEQATAFVDGRSLAVQVNCRALAGPLDEEIPYAVAVSLEVAEGVAIAIYDEIRARVRIGIPIEARNPDR